MLVPCVLRLSSLRFYLFVFTEVLLLLVALVFFLVFLFVCVLDAFGFILDCRLLLFIRVRCVLGGTGLVLRIFRTPVLIFLDTGSI